MMKKEMKFFLQNKLIIYLLNKREIGVEKMDKDIKKKFEELEKRVTVLEEKEMKRSLAMKNFSKDFEDVITSRLQED